MTFYNVISAVLFLGAFQQLLVAVGTMSVSHLLMAATVAALVFNDSLYTPHVVEGERSVQYGLPLMLIDLINFCLLATAIVALNPKMNVFAVDLSSRSAWLSETVFWFILGVYWVMVMIWTWRAGKYRSPYPRRLLVAAAFVAVLFFVEAVFAWSGWGLARDAGRWAALAYFLAYVSLIRPSWLPGPAAQHAAPADAAARRGLTSVSAGDVDELPGAG